MNLSNYCKKHLVNPVELHTILHNNPNLRREVGTVPGDWLEQISGCEQRKQATLDTFQACSDFAKSLHTPKGIYNSTEVNTFQNRLSQILRMPVSLEYLGSGEYGKGFKLSTLKDYVIKIFHKREFPEIYSGAQVEPQAAQFARHNSQRGSFARFWFGKTGDFGQNDTYIVSEFVQGGKNKPIDPVKTIDYIKTCDLNKANIISGKNVDFGCVIQNVSLGTPAERKFARIIVQNIHLKTFEQYFEKHKNNPDFINALFTVRRLYQYTHKKVYLLVEETIANKTADIIKVLNAHSR